jgi:hypothetical protein
MTLATYDLSRPRSQLEQLLASRRRLFTAGVVFAVALATLLTVLSVRPLEDHSLPTQLQIGLAFFLGVLVLGVAMLLPTQTGLRSGAIQLKVDAGGFTLVYADGRSSQMEWNSPNLRFDLIDMTRVAPSALLVDTPFSIRARGVRSLLTPEAYLALASEVRDRGLSEEIRPGNRFLYSSSSAPIEIHVSQGAHKSSSR